jgi:hypothetical protein
VTTPKLPPPLRQAQYRSGFVVASALIATPPAVTLRTARMLSRPASGERPGEGETVAEIEGVAIPRYAADEPRRGRAGDIEAMCLYAGRGVGLVTAVEPAPVVVERTGFELARPG